MWPSDEFHCLCCGCREERRLRYGMHVGFFKIAVGLLNGIPLRMNQRTLNDAAGHFVAVEKLRESRLNRGHV